MIALTGWNTTNDAPDTTPLEPDRHLVKHEMFVECAQCGYEPDERLSMPHYACPKCLASSWQRAVRLPPWALPPAS